MTDCFVIFNCLFEYPLIAKTLTRFDGCVGRSNVRRTGRGTTRIETDVSIGEEERKTKQEKQKQAATKEKKTKNGPKYTVVQVNTTCV